MSEQTTTQLSRSEAAARRAALREATEICDQIADMIAKVNPGRKKGSIAKHAFDAWIQTKNCGERIWKLRAKTKVPAALPEERE